LSKIKNLTRIYKDAGGNFSIEIPEWIIADSGITALCGPSGSGKTSVIRLMLGLDDAPKLEWWWGELNLMSLPIGERRMGVVFQNYDLFPHLTARENILLAAKVRKIPPEVVQNKMAELVGRLQLQNCLDRPAQVLSGGERQRVALARALIGEPRFLFLDEPFSALDAGLRDEARALVKQMLSAYKIPTLMVSHDKEDVRVLADHMVHIQGGRLVQS